MLVIDGGMALECQRNRTSVQSHQRLFEALLNKLSAKELKGRSIKALGRGHVWTAPLRQVLSWRGDDCGRVLSCVWPVDAAILHDC
jgi:hypothetical protein